jgi:hypothetical protein
MVRVIIYTGLQNPYKRKCVRTYMETNRNTIMMSNILPKEPITLFLAMIVLSK